MAFKPRVSALVRANETNYCNIPGCQSHRHSLSKWCLRHLSTYERNGDPQGAPVRPQQWKTYRNKVHELVSANGDHPGLAQAVRFIQQWMESASANEDQGTWAPEMARLMRAGVTPLQVITELAAAWSYLQDYPRVCRSESHRTFTLSKAVLGLAPRPRRFTAKDNMLGGNGYAIKAKPAALVYIGRHLTQALAPLLVNIHQSIQTEQDRASQAVEALRAPFQVAPQAFTQAANRCVSTQLRK
jgi:hypothetical protein